ncbi:MAG: agmatinase [Desulfohalobiaceae bacterium]
MFFNYLDLEPSQGPPEVYVLPVPYEATVSFLPGTSQGPEAILRASYEIETWDEQLGLDLADLANFRTLPFFRSRAAGPEQMLQALQDYLQKELNPDQDFLLLLGGEHTLALAGAFFYQQAHPDLVVLQLDAHADLRSSYQGSPYSHASVMSRIMDLGLPLAQLGIRSLCQEESRCIQDAGPDELLTLFSWDLPEPETAADRLRSFVGSRPVYITFDTDVLDPSQMPGTGTPEPGGLDFAWLQRFWPRFLPGIKLVGMDFCELLPLAGAGVVSQSLAVRCINRILTVYWGAAHD